jgi:hypothetical protein
LLEKEGHTDPAALVAEGEDPLLPHWTRSGAAFAADDHPVNPAQIKITEIFQERLNRQEPHRCRRLAELVYARQSIPPILHAHPQPDVLALR